MVVAVPEGFEGKTPTLTEELGGPDALPLDIAVVTGGSLETSLDMITATGASGKSWYSGAGGSVTRGTVLGVEGPSGSLSDGPVFFSLPDATGALLRGTSSPVFDASSSSSMRTRTPPKLSSVPRSGSIMVNVPRRAFSRSDEGHWGKLLVLFFAFLGTSERKVTWKEATTHALCVVRAQSWRARTDERSIVMERGGRKLCLSGKVKNNCVACTGCPHGKLKCNCAECNCCPHGKAKSSCVDCNSCPHGKRKCDCAACNPCPHGKLKRGCAVCNPCPHGKRKSNCAACNPCPHGKLKNGCKECNCCPHGKLKRSCTTCNPCPHGKVKNWCAACKSARAGRSISPEIKLEPEIKEEPEIKQEPFTIRGYCGLDEGDV